MPSSTTNTLPNNHLLFESHNKATPASSWLAGVCNLLFFPFDYYLFGPNFVLLSLRNGDLKLGEVSHILLSHQPNLFFVIMVKGVLGYYKCNSRGYSLMHRGWPIDLPVWPYRNLSASHTPSFFLALSYSDQSGESILASGGYLVMWPHSQPWEIWTPRTPLFSIL